MALLLHIDTATSYGAVALSNEKNLLATAESKDQKEHATFLHPAIEAVLRNSGTSLSALDAVAVTIGPGSYTGLRVGLAAAKGLCYALQKPLIAVNTLQAMALASSEHPIIGNGKPLLYAPMIDARRMEVFTALYDGQLHTHTDAHALVIDEEVFSKEMNNFFIVFSGDGSKKLKGVLNSNDFVISDAVHTISHVAAIGYDRFLKQQFEDVAYCEPLYVKPFHTTSFVKK
jgi:tRNA threonylcarbamoyladenosine biosynthesis protein TsaB